MSLDKEYPEMDPEDFADELIDVIAKLYVCIADEPEFWGEQKMVQDLFNRMGQMIIASDGTPLWEAPDA